jgi:hypothetical protein
MPTFCTGGGNVWNLISVPLLTALMAYGDYQKLAGRSSWPLGPPTWPHPFTRCPALSVSGKTTNISPSSAVTAYSMNHAISCGKIILHQVVDFHYRLCSYKEVRITGCVCFVGARQILQTFLRAWRCIICFTSRNKASPYEFRFARTSRSKSALAAHRTPISLFRG